MEKLDQMLATVERRLQTKT